MLRFLKNLRVTLRPKRASQKSKIHMELEEKLLDFELAQTRVTFLGMSFASFLPGFAVMHTKGGKQIIEIALKPEEIKNLPLASLEAIAGHYGEIMAVQEFLGRFEKSARAYDIPTKQWTPYEIRGIGKILEELELRRKQK
ncbi:MAG: hypothetical protein PHD95_00900 [Candidatus ainarchaeum sp.]|nr:hypothetical protein [Candidatus ainarchaeum sp.]